MALGGRTPESGAESPEAAPAPERYAFGTKPLHDDGRWRPGNPRGGRPKNWQPQAILRRIMLEKVEHDGEKRSRVDAFFRRQLELAMTDNGVAGIAAAKLIADRVLPPKMVLEGDALAGLPVVRIFSRSVHAAAQGVDAAPGAAGALGAGVVVDAIVLDVPMVPEPGSPGG